MSIRHSLALNLTPLLLRLGLAVVFLWAGSSKLFYSDVVTGERAALLANLGAITPSKGTGLPVTPPDESEFCFALTNPGSEKALKREAEMLNPPWRAGYQRRGFVTFKADAPFTLDSLGVGLACARRLCLSMGRSATREEALARVK
jgi:hypothetical protein